MRGASRDARSASSVRVYGGCSWVSVPEVENESPDLLERAHQRERLVVAGDERKGELIDLIRHDPDNGEQAIDLLMIAKYFERIGDHAQNIAEWAEYSITGVHKGAEL